ncbi:MAG: 5-(carboxyamino)imidazole ribonucleotide synthase [Anaeroplasmataceae bacterium]
MQSKTIGIIGGGQLGMMIIEEAHKLGAKTICLDPSVDCPANQISDEFICSKFSDIHSLELLCQKSDVVTYEFENIDSNSLKLLESKYNIKQGITQLIDSQSRVREKTKALNSGLDVASFYEVNSYEDITKVLNNIKLPCIYKTDSLGYDGHGQEVIKSLDEISKLKKYNNTKGIIEEFVNFDYELSVIYVNDGKNIINFPPSRNIHKNNILDLSIVPSGMNNELEKLIIEKGKKFILNSGYLGIITIEFFVMGNKVYFNEMAPRPHNSGHYTLEACNTNQYKELCNFLLGNEMVTPLLKHNCVMKNILGKNISDIEIFKNKKNAFIHMYGKKDVKENRKMGHVTVLDVTEKEFLKYYK